MNTQLSVVLLLLVSMTSACFLNSCPYRRYGRTLRCGACGRSFFLLFFFIFFSRNIYISFQVQHLKESVQEKDFVVQLKLVSKLQNAPTILFVLRSSAGYCSYLLTTNINIFQINRMAGFCLQAGLCCNTREFVSTTKQQQITTTSCKQQQTIQTIPESCERSLMCV